MTSRAKPAQHRVCGGLFTPNPALPADQNGLHVCRCGLIGKPGDAHHTLPEAPAEADHGQRAAGEAGAE